MTPEQLKASILQRAMEGKLVPQDPTDEPASELLKRIKAEKEKLIADGKIKRDKKETELFRGADGKPYEKLADGTVKEVAVPYDIPDSWEWVRLGNIGCWGSGATPSKSNIKYYEPQSIPWLLTGDLTDGYIIDIPNKISRLALEKTSVKLNPAGSVLIAMYGATIGKLGILTFAATTNQACCACNTLFEVEKFFLFYFLMSERKNFTARAEGGAQPNISKEKIINTLFPLPPLAEQKRIVEQIERALEKVESYSESYNKLQELDKTFPDKLKKSILQYAMQGKLVPQDPNDEPVEVLLEKIKAEKQKLYEEGKLKKKDLGELVVTKGDDSSPYGKIPRNWIQTTLGQIGIITTGNTPPKNDDTNYKGTTPFYKPSDLSQVTLTKASEYLSDIGLTKARKIYKGSLLVNGIGNIGLVGLVGIDGAFNQQMHGIMPFSFVSPRFLMYAIQSDFIQNQFQNNMSSTTIPILNQTKFSQTIVRFPSIEKQDKVISLIEQLFQKVNQLF